MPIDTLKVWCKEVTVDSLTENRQRRSLLDNEYLDGWLRQQSVSYQQLNELFNLLSSYSPPSIFTVYYVESSASGSSEEITANGGSFTQEEAPLLYEEYAGTMPNLTGSAPAGTRPVMRKQ